MSLDQLPEIRTDLFIGGEIRTADDTLQIVDPADGASLPQALLAGNTVVVKPPPTAPLATVRTVQQVAQLLLPGVLNVVTGTDAEIGGALIQDDRVKKVRFTGSPGGGKRIMAMAAESLTRVALELVVTMGPLHSPRQKEYVQELVAQARESGAEVREFGRAADGADLSRGNFLRPSLVLDPADDARVVVEEQFGPTLPILPFDDEDDAVVRANDTWSGLCSSVWTRDPEHAAAIAARLRTGYTFVNAHGAAHLDERAPFGGVNASGMGREMGIEGVREFMDTHAVGFPA